MNEFDHAPIDDLDVVITDLDPIEGASRISKVLTTWEERPSLRKRCWRIITACSTFLFILLVLFSTFPSDKRPYIRYFFAANINSYHCVGNNDSNSGCILWVQCKRSDHVDCRYLSTNNSQHHSRPCSTGLCAGHSNKTFQFESRTSSR